MTSSRSSQRRSPHTDHQKGDRPMTVINVLILIERARSL
jgi:hypothetical protein